MTQKLIECTRSMRHVHGRANNTRIRPVTLPAADYVVIRCFPKIDRGRIYDVAKYVARSNGERNSAARIFRSSCSRSRSRQAIMAAFLPVSLPVSDPSFALSLSLFLSFSFLSRLCVTLSFRLSFAFFPFVPLSSTRSPSSFSVSVASFQFALGFSIPLLAT